MNFLGVLLFLHMVGPVWGVGISAMPPMELTLDQAIAMGLKQNLDIDMAEERLAVLAAQRRQAIGLALPSLNLSALYNRNIKKPAYFFGNQLVSVGADNSMRSTFSLQQYLFAGGAVSQGMKAARLGVEGGRFQLRAAREDVVLTVKRFFYAVCLASETASIQRDSLELAEDHLKTIEKRFHQGLDSDLTVMRQQVEVANAQPALVAALNNHELSLTLLKDTLELDVDAPVRLKGSLEGPRVALIPYETLQEAAVARNPDYQTARKQREQSEALLKVAQGARWPVLSLYGEYQLYSETDAYWPGKNERASAALGGLRLSYPFFTGGQTSGKIAQARAQRDLAVTTQEKIARSIRVEVKRQWLNVQEALQRAQSQQSAISQARRALEATEIRYRAGEASLLEQNDVTLALQKTRLLYADALHDYRVALAALERAVGTPVEESVR